MRRIGAIIRSPAAAVFGLAAVLTLISAWPLARHLSSTLPSDLGDPILETWILWWNAHTMPLTAAWWNAPMFVPLNGAMALSESLLGLAPLTTPLQWMGVGPVAAHNIAFLLSGPLAALSAYVLATRLTTRRDAAVIAALAFGFAPYRIGQLSHLQVLWACWMPFALAALHDFVTTHRTRSLVWFGVCWMMNGFTNGYFLAYFPVLVFLWMLWFVRRREELWKIGITSVLASLPWLPMLYGYKVRQTALGLSRDIGEIRQFSADFSSLLAGSSRSWLSSHWTLKPGPEGELYPGLMLIVIVAIGVAVAWWRSRANDANNTTGAGKVTSRANTVLTSISVAAFAGALAIAATGGAEFRLGPIKVNAHNPSKLFMIALTIGAIALFRSAPAKRAWRQRSPLAFYAAAGAMMFVLAMGPEPKAWGHDLLYRPPYWWLMQLPGFDAVRVPARFGLLMVVALTQACGLAYARLFRAQHRAAWFVSLAILAEGWLPSLPVAQLPNSTAVPPRAIAAGAATLELPVSSDFELNTLALLNGLRHGRPMINGFGGYVPPFYHVLRLGLDEQDPTVLAALRTRSPIAAYVVKSRDTNGRTRALVVGAPGAETLGVDEFGEWFLLPSSIPPAIESDTNELDVKSARTGTRQDAANLMFDDEPLTGWQSNAGPGESDYVDLQFGRAVTVTQIELSLGPWTGDFPRDLQIEAIDGDHRVTVWRGSTAGMTLSAALESKAVHIRIVLSTPTSAPILRLTNVWHVQDRAWSISELRAFGRNERP